MSATSAKVALVSNTTALSGSCPTGVTIVDFVGYGATANCFEGGATAPAPSTTTADLRQSNGCTDTDTNSTDFAAGAPIGASTSNYYARGSLLLDKTAGSSKLSIDKFVNSSAPCPSRPFTAFGTWTTNQP